MQNQPHPTGPRGLGPLNAPFGALAQPKVVLMAAGLLGLALDLFVRPLSWVGLGLIVLATAPWMLQAWSQRSAAGLAPRPAKAALAAEPAGKPRPEQRTVSGGQNAAAARPEQPAPPAREAPRAAPPAEPAMRQPQAPTRAPAGEPRPAPPRPLPGRTPPPKIA